MEFRLVEPKRSWFLCLGLTGWLQSLSQTLADISQGEGLFWVVLGCFAELGFPLDDDRPMNP